MAQLPQNEVIVDAVRKEVKLVPEVVIRELVANALIHQEVSMTGASFMVEIYSNHIEISNPGDPIMPIERFIDGYQSRNERLADLMRRMGICEEKSNGIDRAIQAAEVFQLPRRISAPDSVGLLPRFLDHNLSRAWIVKIGFEPAISIVR
jgi:ATP-dependent DNA helicase RecG